MGIKSSNDCKYSSPLHKPPVSALCPLGILKIVSPGCEGSVESGHPKVRILYTDRNCSRSLLMMRKALQLCCAQNGHFAWIVVLPAAPSFPSPPAAVPLMTRSLLPFRKPHSGQWLCPDSKVHAAGIWGAADSPRLHPGCWQLHLLCGQYRGLCECIRHAHRME